MREGLFQLTVLEASVYIWLTPFLEGLWQNTLVGAQGSRTAPLMAGKKKRGGAQAGPRYPFNGMHPAIRDLPLLRLLLPPSCTTLGSKTLPQEPLGALKIQIK